MNIDIQNYSHYRVSKTYDGYLLFNRETDKVYRIEAEEYAYILMHPHKLIACQLVESKYE